MLNKKIITLHLELSKCKSNLLKHYTRNRYKNKMNAKRNTTDRKELHSTG